ncbi:MAG: NYN domain-containing protein [Candidatus Promineifilaceae bacterium]|nr:NYN domain-containing protein [Candidatus Promineifilaceae bacterium]
MQYLIDGHNLIAKMSDIDLADPDDEAQLVLRLRSWTAASRKRRVTVYFDGGLPGGPAHDLSGARLKVIFASAGRSADDLILHQIRRVNNPPEFTVVSSDREILDAAEKLKMPTIDSEDFAERLEEEAARRAEAERAPSEPSTAKDEPTLSEEEVALWLDLFGPEPEIPQRPRRKRPRKPDTPSPQKGAEKSERRPVRDPRELKDSGESLTEEEVAQWMEMFGPEPDTPEEAERRDEVREAAKEVRRRRRERRRQKRTPPRPADEIKESGAALTEDEVEEWLDIFADPDDD